MANVNHQACVHARSVARDRPKPMCSICYMGFFGVSPHHALSQLGEERLTGRSELNMPCNDCCTHICNSACKVRQIAFQGMPEQPRKPLDGTSNL